MIKGNLTLLFTYINSPVKQEAVAGHFHPGVRKMFYLFIYLIFYERLKG